MTTSPSDVTGYAERIAELVGGAVAEAVATAKVTVPAGEWRNALSAARDAGLVYFSWLSAVDWANEVAVGDPVEEPVDERYEVLCALGDIEDGHLVVFSTDLAKDAPVIDSVVEVFPGAEWHEREAHEMFGIDFTDHPNLEHLYLPSGFLGHPLRKSFALRSREVKPWPGKVDVEGMPGDDDGPSTENPEA